MHLSDLHLRLQALRVAEMIIREDKYKEITSTMPQVINKVTRAHTRRKR